MKSPPVTPVMIVKNGARHLRESLRSLAAFEEVIVYDNGSTDATPAIAETFPNVRVIQGTFQGFGPTRNAAASYAKHDWIFAIDADEVMSPELFAAIASLDFEETHTLYRIDRHNLFMGNLVRHSGWRPDWLVRLYHRGFTRYSERQVHESVVIPSGARVRNLSGALLHHAVDDVSDFLHKSARYCVMEHTGMRNFPAPFIFARALFAFFRTYVLRLGFLDGAKGLVIAVSNFNGTFFKYMHRYFQKERR